MLKYFNFKKFLLAIAVVCVVNTTIFSMINQLMINQVKKTEEYTKAMNEVSLILMEAKLGKDKIKELKNITLEEFAAAQNLKNLQNLMKILSECPYLIWCPCARAPLAKRFLLVAKLVVDVLKTYPDKKRELVITNFAERGCKDPYVIAAALVLFGYKKITVNVIGKEEDLKAYCSDCATLLCRFLNNESDDDKLGKKKLIVLLDDMEDLGAGTDRTLRIKDSSSSVVIDFVYFNDGFEPYVQDVSNGIRKKSNIFTYIDKDQQDEKEITLFGNGNENQKKIPEVSKIFFPNDTIEFDCGNNGEIQMLEENQDSSEFIKLFKPLVDDCNECFNDYGAMYSRLYMPKNVQKKLPTKEEFLKKFYDLAQENKKTIVFKTDYHASIDGDFLQLVDLTKDTSEDVIIYELDGDVSSCCLPKTS